MPENTKKHLNITEKLENSKRLRDGLVRGVVVVLLAIFVGGVAFGVRTLLNNEGRRPPAATPEDTVLYAPRSPYDMFRTIYAALDRAVAERPQLRVRTTYTLRSENAAGIMGDRENLLANAFALTSAHVLETLSEGAYAFESNYGEAIRNALWPIYVAPDSITDAENAFAYYRCKACGYEQDTDFTVCPTCRAADAAEILYRDAYSLRLAYESADGFAGMYHHADAADLATRYAGEFARFGELLGLELSYENPTLHSEITRDGGFIRNLRYGEDVRVTLGLRGAGVYADFGDISIVILLHKDTDFRFTWPAVNAQDKERVLGKKETVQLIVRPDAPEGTQILWKSSNPDIVEVDAEGYISGKKTFGEAVITAYFVLNKRIVSEEITVSVRIPTENIQVNRRRLHLKTGQQKTLRVKFSPANSTDKTVRWESADPRIAAVDANGVVTAWGYGTVQIAAIAQDGFWLSTCTVTVEQ
jgi:hypothetical protein